MTSLKYRKSTHAYQHPSAARDGLRQVDVYVPENIAIGAKGIELLVSEEYHDGVCLENPLSYDCRSSYMVEHGEREA